VDDAIQLLKPFYIHSPHLLVEFTVLKCLSTAVGCPPSCPEEEEDSCEVSPEVDSEDVVSCEVDSEEVDPDVIR
jgi:hypothetical protein